MRIWSIHPRYLDTVGLVALWRETLLAKNVLLGNTIWYKNHPQLIRFRATPDPVGAISQYLSVVLEESIQRGYHFDTSKVGNPNTSIRIPLHSEQLQYEMNHLKKKLEKRSPLVFKQHSSEEVFEFHPMFRVIPGPVENWEIQ